MNKEITYRYHVYAINKNGIAKIDTRTDDNKSVYMVVQDLKDNHVSGYVFDSALKKVSEQF